LKIKEVMIPDLTSVSADTPIKEVVKIMSQQRMVFLISTSFPSKLEKLPIYR